MRRIPALVVEAQLQTNPRKQPVKIDEKIYPEHFFNNEELKLNGKAPFTSMPIGKRSLFLHLEDGAGIVMAICERVTGRLVTLCARPVQKGFPNSLVYFKGREHRASWKVEDRVWKDQGEKRNSCRPRLRCRPVTGRLKDSHIIRG